MVVFGQCSSAALVEVLPVRRDLACLTGSQRNSPEALGVRVTALAATGSATVSLATFTDTNAARREIVGAGFPRRAVTFNEWGSPHFSEGDGTRAPTRPHQPTTCVFVWVRVLRCVRVHCVASIPMCLGWKFSIEWPWVFFGTHTG